MRMLWADDDFSLWTGLEAYLLQAVDKLDSASTVRRALELLSSRVYDAVLMDVLLPEDCFYVSTNRYPGIELARRIRRGDHGEGFDLRKNCSARLIFYTMLHESEIQEAFPEGGVVYLAKGQVSMRDVVSAVLGDAS